MIPRPVTLDDVESSHVRELLEAGYSEREATVLVYVVLGGAKMPRFSPIGCSLSLRPRPVMPEPS